jgi:mannose-1-phosphate guanylyltransferase
MNVVPVILAGGAGTRLWPLSRDDKPKQFHNLSGRGTLLEETIRRLLPLDPGRIIIVTSKRHESLSRDELAKFAIPGVVLSEPRPRNTAAAILYAALYLDSLGDDSVMMVLPADHHIRDTDTFLDILREGVRQAGGGALVTIGITPTYPETGYGYIKASPGQGPGYPIDSFVEKPDSALAKRYFESGNYFWNSGIFLWRTSAIIEQFQALMPAHVKAFEPLSRLETDDIASNEGKAWELKNSIFNEIESVSIDYGVMEKAGNRIVIPGDFGWTDLGSWKSIDDILPPDEKGNRSPERERAIFLDSANCSVFTETSRISVVGLSDVIVVQAEGEILVVQKDAAQEVKKVAEMAKK